MFNENNTWMVSVFHNCKISKLDGYSCLNEVHHQFHMFNYIRKKIIETICCFIIIWNYFFVFNQSIFFPGFCYPWEKRLNSLPKRFAACKIFLVKIGKVFFALFFCFIYLICHSFFFSGKKFYLHRWDFSRFYS